MMQCMMIQSFKIIVNGKTWYYFELEWGIRQRDPFSPHISIICVEYLGRYVHFMPTQKKSGIGIKLNKDFPNISYLMFIDNCITFCNKGSSSKF